MKPVGVCLLALTLTGCGGMTVTRTPIVMPDGSKTYVLQQSMYSELDKRSTEEQLDNHAKELCKSDYELINQESQKIPFSITSIVKWQIKCKNVS